MAAVGDIEGLEGLAAVGKDKGRRQALFRHATGQHGGNQKKVGVTAGRRRVIGVGRERDVTGAVV